MIAARDEAAIAAQLGRAPRGLLAVAHRCPCGLPDVAETAPRLPDGSPFPTLYYLTCPRAAAAVSKLEAAGVMRDMTARLADGTLRRRYEAAHRDYLARRETAARRAAVQPLPPGWALEDRRDYAAAAGLTLTIPPQPPRTPRPRKKRPARTPDTPKLKTVVTLSGARTSTTSIPTRPGRRCAPPWRRSGCGAVGSIRTGRWTSCWHGSIRCLKDGRRSSAPGCRARPSSTWPPTSGAG